MGMFIESVMIIFLYCNTPFYAMGKETVIGGEQFSISLTALFILVFIIIAGGGLLKWYYTRYRG